LVEANRTSAHLEEESRQITRSTLMLGRSK